MSEVEESNREEPDSTNPASDGSEEDQSGDRGEDPTWSSVRRTSSPVKSFAVAKYTSSGPSQFTQLSCNTNLNDPPPNWLRGQFNEGIWSYPLKKRNSSTLSSFRLANRFPDSVGEVDVIADAESIKRLLAIPFERDSHVSMMVHRIGKSLLIDDFDLADCLLRPDRGQFDWLRSWIADRLIGRTSSRRLRLPIAKKQITRQELQTKNMMCKFLHHSLDSDNRDVDQSQFNDRVPDDLIVSPRRGHQEDSSDPTTIFDNQIGVLTGESIDKQIDVIETQIGARFTGHLRNVLWTFEDIRMLVSSNMPIFGDAEHPAVSLRLRDMDKPINVLTGLDYWLDNLMCSVPEVVMCYHSNGIVQKYELIPTDEIPQMNTSASFSPKVIRNVAQNILSFLKSKSTKSGHTYWLFKGKRDDVIKLYDLTDLCADYMQDGDSNPFTVPVAMLLYRVAKNLRDSSDKDKHREAVDSKVYTLLTNCLSLLDHSRHKQIISSAKYMLADALIPSDIDATDLPTTPTDSEYQDDEDDTNYDTNDDSTGEDCPTLRFDNLIHHPSYASRGDCKYPEMKDRNELAGKTWPVKCREALAHVIDGLKLLLDSQDHQNEKSESKDSSWSEPETQNMANPYEAIPLHYKDSSSGQLLTRNRNVFKDWRTCVGLCLLQKAAQIFCLLSELAKKRTARFEFARLGFLCFECAKKIMDKNGQVIASKEPLACLLSLCGDIRMTRYSEDDEADPIDLIINDVDLIEILEKFCGDTLSEEYQEFYKCDGESQEVESRLRMSAKCYEEALLQLGSPVIDDTHSKTGLLERIRKRLASVDNELGCYYLNDCLKKFNEHTGDANDLTKLIETSQRFFDRSLTTFQKCGDKPNVALIRCNAAKLMRTTAHVLTEKSRSDGEFSTAEKNYYLKAIAYYRQALEELGPDADSKYAEIFDNINWELCTTLFNLGLLFQDFAPLSTFAYQTIEKMIIDYFTEALTICTTAEERDSRRKILYQYRAATIHHRLASLHHNSYRNMSGPETKPKQLFQLADDHYDKSQAMFTHLNKLEVLKVALERVGIHEHFLTSLDGFNSKLKELQRILSILLPLATQNYDEVESSDKPDLDKMLHLLVARLQFCVKAMIKCYSKKASKYKEEIKKWKEVDEYMAKLDKNKKLTVFEKLESVSSKINSINLLDCDT